MMGGHINEELLRTSGSDSIPEIQLQSDTADLTVVTTSFSGLSLAVGPQDVSPVERDTGLLSSLSPHSAISVEESPTSRSTDIDQLSGSRFASCPEISQLDSARPRKLDAKTGFKKYLQERYLHDLREQDETKRVEWTSESDEVFDGDVEMDDAEPATPRQLDGKPVFRFPMEPSESSSLRPPATPKTPLSAPIFPPNRCLFFPFHASLPNSPLFHIPVSPFRLMAAPLPNVIPPPLIGPIHLPKNEATDLSLPTPPLSASQSQPVYRCEYCNLQFNKKSVLDLHRTQHLPGFACRICNQHFTSKSDLESHMTRHVQSRTGVGKVYFCHYCDRTFARSDMLSRHIRVHTGLKPYSCSVCSQVFSRTDHLMTHMRTHTGEKPYQCPHCQYSACRRDMITRHLKVHSKRARSRSEEWRHRSSSSHDSADSQYQSEQSVSLSSGADSPVLSPRYVLETHSEEGNGTFRATESSGGDYPRVRVQLCSETSGDSSVASTLADMEERARSLSVASIDRALLTPRSRVLSSDSALSDSSLGSPLNRVGFTHFHLDSGEQNVTKQSQEAGAESSIVPSGS